MRKKKSVGFKTAKKFRGGRPRDKPQVFPIYDSAKMRRNLPAIKVKNPRHNPGNPGRRIDYPVGLTKADIEKEKKFGGYYEILPDGTAVFHPGKYQKEPTMIDGKLWIPQGAKRVVVAKHNPGVQLTALRSPITGAPLEPPLEPGETIAYDPYGGEFVYVKPEGTKPVTPRFTEVHRKSLNIARDYVFQAENEAIKGGLPALIKANRMLDLAQRVEPWHEYPEARLHADPVYKELKSASTFVANMVDSVRATENPIEKRTYVNRGIARVKATAHAMRKA